VCLFGWKAMQRGSRGYDPGLWSAVFPLGMHVVATYNYAAVAGLPFLASVANLLFWFALVVWALTFIGMRLQSLRDRAGLATPADFSG
jgi:tellurite resistance protein TehA-like permease